VQSIADGCDELTDIRTVHEKLTVMSGRISLWDFLANQTRLLVLRGGVIERIDLERRAAALEAKPGAPRPASK